MKCPVCDVVLKMTHREGVEIDYCPKCRGIWLDRGELDKLIDLSRSSGAYETLPVNEDRKRKNDEPRFDDKRKRGKGYDDDRRARYDDDDDDDDDYRDRRYKKRRRRDFLEEIFDIFD